MSLVKVGKNEEGEEEFIGTNRDWRETDRKADELGISIAELLEAKGEAVELETDILQEEELEMQKQDAGDYKEEVAKAMR